MYYSKISTMKKFPLFILFILLLFINQKIFAQQSETGSPIGYWQTIDDETKQKRSIIKIYSQDDVLYGKIIQINYVGNEGPNDLCIKCEGENHNKKILGMVFLNNMKKSPYTENEWFGGQITDPHNGKTYNCKMTLSNNGQQLTVRGYIGLPLLGRSQTWYKLSDDILKNLPKPSANDE